MNPGRRARARGLLLGAGAVLASDVAAKGADPATGAGQVLLGLAVVLGVVFGFAWFVRRLGTLPLSGSPAIQVLGGVSLGPRERVVLIQVGDTQLLVGVAPGRVQTLHALARPVAPPAGGGPAAESVAARLGALLKMRGNR